MAHIGLVHMVMVLQQLMPAYYFTEVLTYSADLIAFGRPFVFLKYGNLVSLGALLAAAAIHSAMEEE